MADILTAMYPFRRGGNELTERMMMNRASASLVAATALAVASVASAQTPAINTVPQPRWYVGAGIGGGHLGRAGSELTGLNNVNIDSNDTTWTVRAGWRFSPFAAVEVGYYDLGRYNFSGTALGNVLPVEGSAKAESVGISLVGIIPIHTFDIYGRIGWAHSEIKLNANAPLITENQNDRENGAMYGAGVRWAFAPNWAVFAEWIKNDRIRVDSYVGGVDFRF